VQVTETDAQVSPLTAVITYRNLSNHVSADTTSVVSATTVVAARENYTDEFRRQAVELYESSPGATVKGIAADLGVKRTTLRLGLDRLGIGTAPTAPEAQR
jgi:transposase